MHRPLSTFPPRESFKQTLLCVQTLYISAMRCLSVVEPNLRSKLIHACQMQTDQHLDRATTLALDMVCEVTMFIYNGLLCF